MQFGVPASQGQSEPDPGVSARKCVVDLGERLKNHRDIRLLHSDAGVTDRKRQPAIRKTTDSH